MKQTTTSKEVAMTTTYAVVIFSAGSYVVSRYFTTKAAALRWARFTSAKFPTTVYRGGQGGELIATLGG
jgi:hypothetical protein